MIQDVKPYTGMSLIYQLEIEPRRIELARHLGTSNQIKVYEETKHDLVDDVDVDSSGSVSGTYARYCWNCRLTLDEIESNTCRKRIGKYE